MKTGGMGSMSWTKWVWAGLRKPNVRAALKQAESSAPKGRIPVAVIRDDRAAAFVALPFEDFLELVREWWELSRR